MPTPDNYREFVHQILYTYMSFPTLLWRYDTIFQKWEGTLGGYNPYLEDPPEQEQSQSDGERDEGNEGGGGPGGKSGGGGKCPPCGSIMRKGKPSGLTLEWGAGKDVKRYIVQWSTRPGCGGKSLRANSVAGGQTKYNLILGKDIKPGQTVFWRVTAIGNNGQSATSKCQPMQFCPSALSKDNVDEVCCKQAKVKTKIKGPSTVACSGDPELCVAKVEYTKKDENGREVCELKSHKWEVVVAEGEEDVPADGDQAGGKKGKALIKIEGPSDKAKCKIIGIGNQPDAYNPSTGKTEKAAGADESEEAILRYTATFKNKMHGTVFKCHEDLSVTVDCDASTINKKPWLGQNSQLTQLRQIHPSCLQLWKTLCAQMMSGGMPTIPPTGSKVSRFFTGLISPETRFGDSYYYMPAYIYYTGAGYSFYGPTFYGYGAWYGLPKLTNYKFGGRNQPEGVSPSFGINPSGASMKSLSETGGFGGVGSENIESLGMAGSFLSPGMEQQLAGNRAAIVLKPVESEFESQYGITWGPPVRALKSHLENDFYLYQTTSTLGGTHEIGTWQQLDGPYFNYNLNLGDVGKGPGALTIKQPGRYWVTINVQAEHTLSASQSSGGFGSNAQMGRIGFEAYILHNQSLIPESKTTVKQFSGTSMDTTHLSATKRILLHLNIDDTLAIQIRKNTGSSTVKLADQWLNPTIKADMTFISLEPISSTNY